MSDLSPSQTAVLQHLANGITTYAQIGALMGISRETVSSHTEMAVLKLGARNRTQAVAFALRRGLIS